MDNKVVQNTRFIIDILSRKWAIEILFLIYHEGRVRFGEITDALPGLSNKVLSERLEDLQKHEIVEKIVHNIVPLTIKYRLFPKASELFPLLIKLSNIALQLEINRK